MSFFLTTPQFRDGSKDVTRRSGWRNLKAGDHFMAVVKGQGLKKGEKVERLGECICVSNTLERLDRIVSEPVRAPSERRECAREGFPEISGTGFVVMFCQHMGGDGAQEVSRIEFMRYTPRH